MQAKIRIPKFLKELHGEETSVFSILLVYLTGLTFGLFYIIYSPDFHIEFYRWILALLAVDIGGGVVANMTQSTSEYYAKRPKMRWIFIIIHIIHPIILWIIFSKMNGILFVGGTTIIFTSIVNLISGLSNQRIVSSTFFVINLMLLFVFKVDILPLILLTVFSMKLIMCFGVRWSGLH
jgi:hypothetical protein